MTDKDKELKENIKFLAKCCSDEYNDIRIDAVLLGALELINRQQTEIERLKQENKEYCEANRIIAYQRNQRDVEIQALHNELNGLNFMEQQIKSEAVKEFAEILKKRNDDFCVDKSDMDFVVDSIVKEMVGDTE